MNSAARFLVSLVAVSCVVSAQTLPKVAPAQPTSYADVAKYLNPNGTLYAYMNTEQWGAKLDGFAAKLAEAIGGVMEGDDEVGAQLAFHFIRSFINDSGLRDTRGVGMSSVPEGNGMYHNRSAVIHTMPGPPKGLFWDMSVSDNGKLKMLDMIPEDAVFAAQGVFRGAPLWNWVKKTILASDYEPMAAGFNQFIMMTRGQGIDLDQWFESLGPAMGVVATVSRTEKAVVPLPTGEQMEMPQMAAAILFQVKDDSIFQFIDAALQALPNVVRNDDGDLRMRSIQLPVPIPIRVQPTIARLGSYLILASNADIVQAMDACRHGETPTIQRNEEFRSLSAGLPTEGMGYSFVSRRFNDTIVGIMQTAMAADPETRGMAGLMATAEGQAAYSVSVRMPDGVVTVSRSNFDMGEVLIAQCAVVPAAIMAGAMLPALSQARGRARQISDINNLKQIGLGLIMCQDDNDGKFPDDLGAVLPYVGDGQVFKSPTSKTPAPANAEDIRAGKCDYLYFGKGKTIQTVKQPSSTPLACTKPGLLRQGVNVLYCDGHVESKPFIDEELKALIKAAGHPMP